MSLRVKKIFGYQNTEHRIVSSYRKRNQIILQYSILVILYRICMKDVEIQNILNTASKLLWIVAG